MTIIKKKKKAKKPIPRKKKTIGPVDSLWFTNLLEERGLTQRTLADAVGLDQSHVSRMAAAKRRMTLEESVAIAKVLQVPHDGLLKRFGVDLEGLESQRADFIPVSGVIGGPKLAVTWGAKEVKGPKTAHCPFADRDIQVLRCQTGGTKWESLDGALVYFNRALTPPPLIEAIGKISLVVIEGDNEGTSFLRVLKRGYVAGKYTLTSIGGGETLEQEVGIKSATAIQWMKF